MPIAITPRLILRNFQSVDVEPMMAVFGDPEVMFHGPGIKPREWVERWIARKMAEYGQRRGFGMWAVESAAESALIGYCGLTSYPDVGGRPEVEVGYRLARQAGAYASFMTTA